MWIHYRDPSGTAGAARNAISDPSPTLPFTGRMGGTDPYHLLSRAPLLAHVALRSYVFYALFRFVIGLRTLCADDATAPQ